MFVFLNPRPSALISALGSYLVGPRPPKYWTTKYNTII